MQPSPFEQIDNKGILVLVLCYSIVSYESITHAMHELHNMFSIFLNDKIKEN